MTDAREIIAQEFMRAHRDTCYPDASAGECEIAASAIVAALTSAGFRILGPDEIDGPTVDKCAEVADERKDMRERLYAENQASINSYKAVEAEEIATAIHALHEKRT